MADFLDSIGERLEEMAAGIQIAMATVFRCPSYKLVPASFVVIPTVNTAITPIDEITKTINILETNDLTNDTGNRTEEIPVRREVDFDYIVNYQLETSKNGRLT